MEEVQFPMGKEMVKKYINSAFILGILSLLFVELLAWGLYSIVVALI